MTNRFLILAIGWILILVQQAYPMSEWKILGPTIDQFDIGATIERIENKTATATDFSVLIHYLLQESNTRDAKPYLGKMKKAYGETIEFYDCSMLYYASTENMNEARKWGEKLIQIQPNHTGGNYMMGFISKKRGELSEALRFYNTAISNSMSWSNNGQAHLHWERGNVYAMIKNDSLDALNDFLQTVALDPQMSMAWHDLGVSYHLLSRDNEAIEAWKTGIESDQTNHMGYTKLVAKLSRMGRYEEAYDYLTKMYQQTKTNPKAIQDIYALDREIQKGIAQSVELDTASLYQKRTFKLFGEKNYQAALDAIYEAHRLRPDYFNYQWNTAEILEALGRKAEATKNEIEIVRNEIGRMGLESSDVIFVIPKTHSYKTDLIKRDMPEAKIMTPSKMGATEQLFGALNLSQASKPGFELFAFNDDHKIHRSNAVFITYGDGGYNEYQGMTIHLYSSQSNEYYQMLISFDANKIKAMPSNTLFIRIYPH